MDEDEDTTTTTKTKKHTQINTQIQVRDTSWNSMYVKLRAQSNATASACNFFHATTGNKH